MSIVFTPKIAFNFGSGRVQPVKDKKPKPMQYWSNVELGKLCDLRALGLSYSDCAKMLERSVSSCQSAVDERSLYIRIMRAREKLIENVINPKESEDV